MIFPLIFEYGGPMRLSGPGFFVCIGQYLVQGPWEAEQERKK